MRRGITLIELLGSMSILAIAMMALAQLTSSVLNQMPKAQRTMEANLQADTLLHDLRSDVDTAQAINVRYEQHLIPATQPQTQPTSKPDSQPAPSSTPAPRVEQRPQPPIPMLPMGKPGGPMPGMMSMGPMGSMRPFGQMAPYAPPRPQVPDEPPAPYLPPAAYRNVDIIMLQTPAGLVRYEITDETATRYAPDGTTKAWPMHYVQIEFAAWIKEGKAYALEVRTAARPRELAGVSGKLANSHVFFMKSSRPDVEAHK